MAVRDDYLVTEKDVMPTPRDRALIEYLARLENRMVLQLNELRTLHGLPDLPGVTRLDVWNRFKQLWRAE